MNDYEQNQVQSGPKREADPEKFMVANLTQRFSGTEYTSKNVSEFLIQSFGLLPSNLGKLNGGMAEFQFRAKPLGA